MYHNYPYTPVYRKMAENMVNSLRVIGEGVVTAPPNQASATIGVVSEGKDLKMVQKENTETVSRIVSVLNSFQIPPANVQTFDYQVSSEYDYIDGKQVFRGYRVQTLLKVTIDNVGQLSEIINRVIGAGANYVSNVQFQVSNPQKYYLLALQAALRNGHQKAEVIVTDLKVSWNPTPIRVEELRKGTGPIEPQMTYIKAVSTEQFQPGILRFSAEILLIYQYS
jgi:uncharacterized protein